MVQEVLILVLILFVAMIVLSALATRLQIPYAIVLVVGGVLVGLLPLPFAFQLDPDLVLFIFLPPLLYASAWSTSWRDFRRQWNAILILAIGLVLVTTVCVAFVVHLLIPQLSWSVAFVLGAIVSPTDAVAAEAIIKKLGLQHRVAATIEGESLLNDATALVAYSFAIGAVSTGSFSLLNASLSFVWVCVGGIGLGLLIALPAMWLHRRIDDTPSQIVISLLTPFTAYLLAESLGASGVLAVVVAGLLLGRQSANFYSSDTRLQADSFWNVLVFLFNGFIFLLIGLELSQIITRLQKEQPVPAVSLLGYILIVILVVVIVRLLWPLLTGFLLHLLPHASGELPLARSLLVVGWSGMRGGVSMATALAIPTTIASGAPFPDRDLLIILTLAVIIFTLVVQGTTLGPLIRFLKLGNDSSLRDEQRLAVQTATQAALDRLRELNESGQISDSALERLQKYYGRRIDLLSQDVDSEDVQHHFATLADVQQARQSVRQAERQALISIRNAGKINDDVFHQIERNLDLEEQRLQEMQ